MAALNSLKRSLGIRYQHNNKAWMMAADFSNWVKDWSQKLQAKTQKIILMLDNALLGARRQP
jgi:hypothetical protein